MLRSVRDLILAIYAVTWSAITIITVIQTRAVPMELYLALGGGVGAILGAFRVADGGGGPGVDRGSRRRDADAAELEETPS